LGNFETLQIGKFNYDIDEKQNSYSLKHYEYSIEVEESLKGNVGKYENWIKIVIET
jgi:hypothetical protein